VPRANVASFAGRYGTSIWEGFSTSVKTAGDSNANQYDWLSIGSAIIQLRLRSCRVVTAGKRVADLNDLGLSVTVAMLAGEGFPAIFNPYPVRFLA
jgi:hypothetical protein